MTIPKGARVLLDYIYSLEAPRGYDTLFANRQDRLPRPLTSMTVGEVLTAQRTWAAWEQPASSAAGAPQFIRTTLSRLVTKLAIPLDTKFSPTLQDQLAYTLLLERGYAQFVSGTISRPEYGNRLAKEWASLPVLGAMQGAHRPIQRGDSYYTGDKLNRSLSGAERFESVLYAAYVAATETRPPRPAPAPAAPPAKPEPKVAGWLQRLIAFIVALFRRK